MIIGTHSIIYSTNPEADRAFLRDVLGLPNVDVGDGWLIFGLPPSEVAVHPSDENDIHEFFLMCGDVHAFVAEMAARAVVCSPVEDRVWGLFTQVTLPGGGRLGVYEPRHARPKPARTRPATPKKKPHARKTAAKGTRRRAKTTVRNVPKRKVTARKAPTRKASRR